MFPFKQYIFIVEKVLPRHRRSVRDKKDSAWADVI
jgi:hypothetical protein